MISTQHLQDKVENIQISFDGKYETDETDINKITARYNTLIQDCFYKSSNIKLIHFIFVFPSEFIFNTLALDRHTKK